MNQINVVPYIDVMLVLLVIFMVTAPLVSPGAIELPSVGSRLTVPAAPMEVELRSDGSLWLTDRQTAAPAERVGADELVQRVRQKQSRLPDQPVVIAASASARYEEVLRVLDRLQQGGAKRVGLLARPSAK